MSSVLSVAYRLAPVRAESIGGAEQVLAALDRALVAAGHQSTVLACEGSSVHGTLRAVTIGAGPWTEGRRALAAQRFSQELERLLHERRFDLIHFHGVDVASYPLDAPWLRAVPKLITLHLPLDWYAPELFQNAGHLGFNTVSEWQHRRVPRGIPVRASIPNGVDLSEWRPAMRPAGGYFLCLGRICPEKGFDRALRAARAAGARLVLAGHTFDYDEHQRHFRDDIAPLLDAERRFIGPVTGAQKRDLLAHASALLVPSRVAETCSLVALEALACGTPVIASNTGAPASLIEPGVTGWLEEDDADLAAALSRAPLLSRVACRQRAEQFDLRETTRRYLELYADLARELEPNPSAPPRVIL